MPPRRSHTKSRNGCDQCKKRRVKCDERGPPCSNCISRELECTYLGTQSARSTSSAPATPVSVQSQNTGQFLDQSCPRLASTQLASTSKVLENRSLELMHKFSTETYQSLCNDPSDLYVWQIVIPQRALHYDFLMSGILSIASLHIASAMDPPHALAYVNTALEFHSRALTPFRHAVNDINPENCEAVFAHSVVTTVIGIALPQLTTQREEGSRMTENITVVFELLQGVSQIHNITRPWLNRKLFTTGDGNADFWSSPACKLDKATDAALKNLDILIDDSRVDTGRQKMVNRASTLLRRCFIRYADERDMASILAWLAVVDKEFVDALRNRQPLALLVLMYWAVLLHELDGKVWWARNSGSALVRELQAELQDHDTRWEHALSWPRQQISLPKTSASANTNYKAS